MFLSISRRALHTIATRTRTRTPTRFSVHPLSFPSSRSLFSSECPLRSSPSSYTATSSSSSSILITSSTLWARCICTKADAVDTEDANNISGPLPLDSSLLIDEREFHRLADELLDYIQEKVDEIGEELDIDGFDIDHAEGVVTIKLGASGTYVINKQTPNRQIWLSSPVSGPARFDWDAKHNHWVYRRTKARLLELLEKEMNQLLSASITFTTFKQQ